MKRVLCLLLVAVLLLPAAACQDDDQPDGSQPPSPTAPREPAEIPTVSTPTDTMVIDDLLSIVNQIVVFEEGYEFDKKYAEAWPYEDEIIYHFNRVETEVVLFADRETDNFLYGYFRTWWNDAEVAFAMASISGAFLKALEPNQYDRMILEIMAYADKGEDDEDEHFWAEGFEPISSSGEFWTILNEGSLINIFPNEYQQ